MQNKKKESEWSQLEPHQKKLRITVYTILSILFALGVLAIIFKPVILGIVLCFISLTAFYILWRLPKYIIRSYCEKAEKEYQLHKNDKDSNKIYLSGDQMYKFLNNEVVDLGPGTKPFRYEDVVKNMNTIKEPK